MYDVHTKAGRDALDKATRKLLSAKTGKSRGTIAEQLGVTPAHTSASLRRLYKAGQAHAVGRNSTSRWFRG